MVKLALLFLNRSGSLSFFGSLDADEKGDDFVKVLVAEDAVKLNVPLHPHQQEITPFVSATHTPVTEMVVVAVGEVLGVSPLAPSVLTLSTIGLAHRLSLR